MFSAFGVVPVGEVANATPFSVRVQNLDCNASKGAKAIGVEIEPHSRNKGSLGNFPWVDTADMLQKQRLNIWIDGQLRFYVWQSSGLHYYSDAKWDPLQIVDWDRVYNERTQFGPEKDPTMHISEHGISKSKDMLAETTGNSSVRVELGHTNGIKIAARLSDWIYDPHNQTCPREVQVRELHSSHRSCAIQYAICIDVPTNPKKCYIVFRGTVMNRLADWAVNFSITAAKMSSANDLVVHGGTLNELQNPMAPVLEGLAERPDLKQAKENGAEIFVCGHSLGGGYAVLAAAHLLHAGFTVSQVYAFGSPQYVAKGQETNSVWQDLNRITTTVVHNCDLVPRTLGTCAESWVLNFAGPMLEKETINSVRGFDVSNAIGKRKIAAAVAAAAVATGAAPLAAGAVVAVAVVGGYAAVCKTKELASANAATPVLRGLLESLQKMDEKLYYYHPIGRVYRVGAVDARGERTKFASHSGEPLDNVVMADTPDEAAKLLKAFCHYPEEKLSTTLMLHDHGTGDYIKSVDLLVAASQQAGGEQDD
jgi:hypothetical protein